MPALALPTQAPRPHDGDSYVLTETNLCIEAPPDHPLEDRTRSVVDVHDQTSGQIVGKTAHPLQRTSVGHGDAYRRGWRATFRDMDLYGEVVPGSPWIPLYQVRPRYR